MSLLPWKQNQQPACNDGALLGAIVCPLTAGELPAALRNLADWSGRMALETPGPVPKPALIFSFNCAERDDLRNPLQDCFGAHARLQDHFDRIEVQFCDLPPEKDVYLRHATDEVFPYGRTAGPNWLFYETIKRLRSRFEFVFLMETDCTPIRPDWLKCLEEACRNNREAWVVGSHYRGIAPLDWTYARHINGNALYNVGDARFAHFLDDVLWPWMHRYIAQFDSALAYDCAWELFLNKADMEDPANYDWIIARNVLNRFRICDQIVNVGGTAERSGEYVWTEEDIRAHHSLAAVVHGPLAPPGNPRGQVALGKARGRGNFSICDGELHYDGPGRNAIFARSVWFPGKPFDSGMGLRLSVALEVDADAGIDVRAVDPNGRLMGPNIRLAGQDGNGAAKGLALVPAFASKLPFVRISIRPVGTGETIKLKLTSARAEIFAPDSSVLAQADLLDGCPQIAPWGDEASDSSTTLDLEPSEAQTSGAVAGCISPGPRISGDGTSIGRVRLDSAQISPGRALFTISLSNVKIGQSIWPRMKFKFCINAKGRALEFRKGAEWPKMFDQWPTSAADKHGPVFHVRDKKPFANQLQRWTSSMDRDVVRLIATHLPKILELAAEQDDEMKRDIETWQAEARTLSENILGRTGGDTDSRSTSYGETGFAEQQAGVNRTGAQPRQATADTLQGSLQITIDGTVCQLPPLASASTGGGFAFSLYKAGSTMLFDALSRIVAGCDARYFDFTQFFWNAGILLDECELDTGNKDRICHYLDRPGVVFSGWREFPSNYPLPLHQNSRTCLLVRDPRDILVSHYFSLKFSHTTKGPDSALISRAREDLLTEEIDAFALRMAPRVAQYFADYRRLAATRLKVHRYEDIIFAKERFLQEVCEHFELDVGERRIARVAQAIDLRPEAEDVFSHVRQVSPGDHKNKLRPYTIERLNGVLRDALADHGYQIAPS